MPILPLALTLNLMKDAAKVEAIDYTADFENLFGQFDAYTKFYNTGKTKNDLVRYIPGLTKPARQGQIDAEKSLTLTILIKVLKLQHLI